MWAVTELSLRRMREGTFYLLILIGIVVCVLADSADPISGQVAKESLFALCVERRIGERSADHRRELRGDADLHSAGGIFRFVRNSR